MAKHLKVWHPDSPGVYVDIPDRWWNRYRQFATLGQTVRYYRREGLWTL